MVIAYRNGAAVRLADVAEVLDSVENVRNVGLANGEAAVLVILYRQPGANIIETVDRVTRAHPGAQGLHPHRHRHQGGDGPHRHHPLLAQCGGSARSRIAVGLVILVVFLFLRNWRATLVPAVAVPISLLGTFGAMYLLGYSLDNLSLMALIIATGFVVDDAIVVLENITRHIEAGMPRFQAAILGSREVGFTVLSMSLSLVAVFIPILMMGGMVGRLFREFSITLSVAVLVSLLVSLTTTPMMCSRLIRRQDAARRGAAVPAQRARLPGDAATATRARCAGRCATGALVMVLLAATVAFNIYLYVVDPEGLLPAAGHRPPDRRHPGRPGISFQSMSVKLRQFIHLVQADPAVDTVVGFTGGGSQAAARRTAASSSSRSSRRRSASCPPTRSSPGCGRS